MDYFCIPSSISSFKSPHFLDQLAVKLLWVTLKANWLLRLTAYGRFDCVTDLAINWRFDCVAQLAINWKFDCVTDLAIDWRFDCVTELAII